jgi:sulfite exporter TauE/SafE
MNIASLIPIFLTGLITGGLTCMAVQGGLLAATLAQREEEKLKNGLKSGGNALPIVAFLIAKLAAYTALGFLLGSLGSVFQLSITLKVVMQIAVGVFMLGTAFNILNVHPIFRYFVIQPPKFLTRLVRKQSKSQDVFAPAILGSLTIFIPCGTTQAMMALAIASGSPFVGASVLFAFILGTSPVFFILGFFAAKLGDIFQQKFMKIAAFAIIILAIFNINNAVALSGSNLTLENIGKNVWCTFTICSNSASGGVASEINNSPTITILSLGYNPNSINVKAGAQVKLKLVNTTGTSCVQAFTIPSLGLQKIVPPGTSDELDFTAPTTPGQIPFMCSMGMYRGVINVL